MKRLLRLLPVYFLLFATAASAADIYVAPNGSDLNTGSKEQPLATLQAALRKARNLRRMNDESIKGGIHIILRGGVYTVLETVILRPEDSGTSDSPTFIEAAPNEQPVLSGGVAIMNWKKLITPVAGLQTKYQGQIWVADVPAVNGNGFNFRQLWVNDIKAVRAKSSNGETMLRILNWNKQEADLCYTNTVFSKFRKGKRSGVIYSPVVGDCKPAHKKNAGNGRQYQTVFSSARK